MKTLTQNKPQQSLLGFCTMCRTCWRRIHHGGISCAWPAIACSLWALCLHFCGVSEQLFWWTDSAAGWGLSMVRTLLIQICLQRTTSVSQACILFFYGMGLKQTSSPCPVVSLGLKVWDPVDFLAPWFPGGSSTNLGLGDTTTVPLDSPCKSLSKNIWDSERSLSDVRFR